MIFEYVYYAISSLSITYKDPPFGRSRSKQKMVLTVIHHAEIGVYNWIQGDGYDTNTGIWKGLFVLPCERTLRGFFANSIALPGIDPVQIQALIRRCEMENIFNGYICAD